MSISLVPSLVARYRFFREQWETPSRALDLARAEEWKDTRDDVEVRWEDETDPWDGDDDCPPPAYVLCCMVQCGDAYESLGMVGVNDYRDPYVRVVEAELLAQLRNQVESAERLTVLRSRVENAVAEGW